LTKIRIAAAQGRYSYTL